ncbi:hypothetical protein A2U01_0084473, partial [Trifolium medium]|nr:hypothetical protein [Trifolium medium]
LVNAVVNAGPPAASTAVDGDFTAIHGRVPVTGTVAGNGAPAAGHH